MSQTITGLRTASLSLTAPAYSSPLTLEGTIAVAAGLGGLFGVAASSAWYVENTGTVLASAEEGTGISLAAGGQVSNAAAALISGYDAGLVVTGAAGTITNAGTIAALEASGGTIGANGHVEAIGVFLGAGGVVDNVVGGVILGGAVGLDLAAATGASAINAGIISARPSTGTAARVGAGDVLSNAAGGVITIAGASTSIAPVYPFGGVGVAAIGGTLTNAGTIVATGFGATGVELARGGVLTNDATLAGYASAVYGYQSGTASGANSIVNTGLITATGSGTGSAVRLVGNAAFTNAAGAVVASAEGGVSVRGGTSRIVNDGAILASGTLAGDNAIGFYAAGLLSNSLSGTIAGGAVLADGATLVNGGLISAGLRISAAIGTNTGTIAATASYADAMLIANGELTNSGLIRGWNGIGATSVSGSADDTIVNSGTIAGVGNATTSASSGTGISLRGGALLTNAVSGRISGVAGAVYAAYATVTLANSGTIVETGTNTNAAVNFARGGYVFNAAAGVISAAAGAGVVIGGSGIDAGTLVNAGTIAGAASGAASAVAAAAALVAVLPGATFEGQVHGTELLLGGTAAASLSGFGSHYGGFSTLAFAPGATWSVGGSYAAFAYGTAGHSLIVRGFQAGDAITLSGLAATGYAFSGPFLTLTGGAGPVTLDLLGRLSPGIFALTPEAGATVLTTDRTILSNAVATLSATYARPIRLSAPYYAASVTNLGTTEQGISAAQSWTLVNEGSLGGSYAVLFGDGGVITNMAGAAIGGTGSTDAIRNLAGLLTLDNAGTIVGQAGVAGVQTLDNAGTIEAALSAGVAAGIAGAGSTTLAVTNAVTGLILGVTAGLDIHGAYATLLNQGRIAASGTAGAGLVFNTGGTLAGLIDNAKDASITGANYGVEAQSGFTLTNAGTISASGTAGVGLGQSAGFKATLDNLTNALIAGVTADVSLQAGGNVTNAGTILATAGAGFYAGGNLALLNAAGGIIEGSTLGVVMTSTLAGAGPVVWNAGTIAALSAGGTAVAFAAGHDNELIAYAGAQFLGTILGGNAIGGTYTSDLVLATGSGIGTIAGFTNFAYIDISQGATWDVIGSTGALGGLIRGFMPGDTIDIQGVTANSVAVSGGVVTLLAAGSVTASLRMPTPLGASAFGLTSDGAGGVLLTATGPVTPRAVLAGTYDAAINLDPTNYASVVTVTGAVSVNSKFTAMLEHGGNPWTVVNRGQIVNADPSIGVGLYLYDGGFVSNAQGATIAGGFDGVYLDGPGSMVNAGFVSGGPKGAGVNIYSAGANSFTNLTTGTIISSYQGLLMAAPGIAVNEGSISGAGVGAMIRNGATLINAAGGQIAGETGVSFQSSGVLIDNGTILGGVRLDAAATDRVVLAPTAVLAGGVGLYGTGPGRYGQTLELAAGVQAGTLAGFGGSINGFGTVVFDPGAQWTVAGNAAGLGVGEVIDTGSIYLSFDGFTVGDAIDIAGFAATQSAFGNGLLTLVGTAGSITSNETLSLPGSFTAASFRITNDGQGGTNIAVACFAAGSNLLAATGELPVEALCAGMWLMTPSGRLRGVRWVGRRRLTPARHPRPWDVNPVRVRKDAFAPDVPHRDLLLSPDHAVLVGGRLIPVRYLVNGVTIVQEEVASVTYFHVELDAHDVVLAEGLACESYLDTGNRHAFEGEGRVAMLHTAFGRDAWVRAGCADLVLEGEALTAARAALLARAGALGWRLEAATPRIEVDGNLVVAMRRGRRHSVALPADARQLRLVSLHGKPGETAADGTDMRELGIAVARLALDGRRIALSDARLGAGWHDLEPVWRWTDGAGEIDVRGARRFAFDLMTAERGWVRKVADDTRRPQANDARAGGRASRG